MEETSFKSSFWNALIVFISITPFFLSFVPEIDIYWRTILLVISPTILCLICFYFFLKQNDEIMKSINNLEEKLKRSEELIDMRADIKYLKNKLK